MELLRFTEISKTTRDSKPLSQMKRYLAAGYSGLKARITSHFMTGMNSKLCDKLLSLKISNLFIGLMTADLLFLLSKALSIYSNSIRMKLRRQNKVTSMKTKKKTVLKLPLNLSMSSRTSLAQDYGYQTSVSHLLTRKDLYSTLSMGKS